MCVPLGHRIVTRELVMQWADHLVQVASTLDLRRLVKALLRRAAALPGRLVDELKRFRAFLSRGEDPVANLTTWGWRFFSVLMLVLVLAQTAMPTAVYAKGGVGHSSGHGTYFAYPPGWSARSWGWNHRMMPQPRFGGGYVSGGAGTVTSPYYYWYSDPYYHYYYCFYDGRYYYTCVPR
jgi:hypothetical protein